MEESQQVEEEEELKELNLAATQALEFLGQAYVSLSGFHAVEEFLCEEYAASRRFLFRCLSRSPSLSNVAFSSEYLTSRKNPAPSTSRQSIPKSLNIPVQRNSRITDLQPDQATVPEGGSDSDDGRILKAIESLCKSIDSVLEKARNVREKPETTRKASKPSGQRGVSSGTTPEDAGTATAKKANSKSFVVAKAGARTKNVVPRQFIKGPRKTAKSGRPSPRTVEASNVLGDITTGVRNMTEPTKECQPPETNPAERINKEFANESDSNGKKTWARSRLQLPEKLCSLLAWFKSRGISLDDPLNIPRTEAQAAKQGFLSILNEVNKQQDYYDHKDSKEAAARVEETQGVLEELACHVSPFDMRLLLRAAPAGSTIAQQRDFGIRKVLRAQFQQGATPSSTARCQVTYSGALTQLHRQIRTLSWLPQNCWPYFAEAVESLSSGSNEELDITQMIQRTFTSYTDLEHVLVMARLWHVIQVTLFQCYWEDVVAAPLLPNRPARDELINLFRCRLAHSILCREGRGFMVMAERLVTPY